MRRIGMAVVTLVPLVLGLAAVVGLVLFLAWGWAETAGALAATAVVASTRPVIVLRPFTELDWMSYAGATRAPDGRAPMIGERDGLNLIADALGIEVTFYRLNEAGEADAWAGEDVYRYDLANAPSDQTYSMAVYLASALPAAMTPAYLLGLGFSKVGG